MPVDVPALARSLTAEARETNERRLLVLAGERERGYDILESVLDTLSVPISGTTLVGPDDRLRCEQLLQARAGDLLGTTRDLVALDAHEGLRPNALGAVVGTVDGGGLLVLLTPSLADWPDHCGAFEQSLAVAPFGLEAVTGRFRRRLVETLRSHRGIAIVDLETERAEDGGPRIEREGLVRPAPRVSRQTDPRSTVPADPRFPLEAYDACLTTDQADALAAFESLVSAESATEQTSRQRALILEADRGRGKSSAAGLAAGTLAAEGVSVLVTAPRWRNAREVFERARELCTTLGCVRADKSSLEYVRSNERNVSDSKSRVLETTTGGRVHFLEPAAATDPTVLEAADVVIVDEAAALPVRTLESFLVADRIAFVTTIHGYEGAGRGFSVRFRDRLAESDHTLEERTLTEPIRYAAGDPLEVWAFRALLLDARPPVEQLVADARPERVEYQRLEPETLLADETLLREAFGLLVLAHYRTEPNDLARLLDAPNLEVRALTFEGHVVSVALLAREGNLSAERRAAMYEGRRVRGNMLPDILTSQLRDEQAGAPAGLRVVRIATHHAVRSRGLGSQLLECIREEFDDIDWLGVGFGATPGLVGFWRDSGYRTVHVSTTRNEASGEYSALMLCPTSDVGHRLSERHTRQFARRFAAVCSDSLSDLEPDVVRAVLKSVGPDTAPSLEMTDREWQIVASAAYGPGLFDVDPGPFRRLAMQFLLERPDAVSLSEREQRLLVLRVLQGRPWSAVADRLDYHSAGQCRRALGEVYCPLVDQYGTDAALEVRERFADD